MLFIKDEKKLAGLLKTSLHELHQVLDHADDFYELLKLHNPARPDRPRDIVSFKGQLRQFQARLYRDVLLKRLSISPYSHGGVRGRSAKTNIAPHLNSAFVFKADVSNFFPSISQTRVYRLFSEQFECRARVAALCTRLCTFDHHLALGLITSPILADQLIQRSDHRIGQLCEKSKLRYTRFVDDITISGNFDLRKSGIPSLVGKILTQNGLQLNGKKLDFGSLDDGIAISGIRCNRRGNLDVVRDYAEELLHILADCDRLARGFPHDKARPYYTRAQIRGRLQFVSWINRGRGIRLLGRFRQIDWNRVEISAREQKLCVCIKQVRRRDEQPTCVMA